MVNAIARGPGSKGHSRVSLASASGREHRSRIGRDCVRGFCSGGFSAVYALAHAGLRQGGWVRRLVALRGQASASALLIALLLPGCTVGPDYSREPAPVPTTYKELKGWKLANPNDAADRGNWWAPYRDSRLDTLLRQVEISNQTVAAAAAAYEQSRAIVREGQSALFPTGTASLRRHSHADWRARRHHRRQLGRDGSRHPLHDAIFRADQRRLGSRRLGQDPAHHRSRRVVGAGQRRRSRQRQTVGAGPARHRLFQPARGQFTARPPAPLRRAVPRNLRDHAQQIQSRLRAQRHDGDNQRRRGAGPIASSGHRSPGTERRRTARPIRACHRGSDRQAAGRADDWTALAGF